MLMWVCRLGSTSLDIDAVSVDDAAAAAAAVAAATQRIHLQRIAAAAAAMRYSPYHRPYHLTPHPCLPLPGLSLYPLRSLISLSLSLSLCHVACD